MNNDLTSYLAEAKQKKGKSNWGGRTFIFWVNREFMPKGINLHQSIITQELEEAVESVHKATLSAGESLSLGSNLTKVMKQF